MQNTILDILPVNYVTYLLNCITFEPKQCANLWPAKKQHNISGGKLMLGETRLFLVWFFV